jgi:hypothetical protein
MVYEGGKRARLGFPIIGAVIGAIAAWTIIATLVFPTATAVWLAFASGLAYAGLAISGLVFGELTTERVVHHLQVGERTEAEERAEHAATAA